MDISYIIPILGILILCAAAVLCFRGVGRIPNPRLRLTLRIVFGLLAAITILPATLLLFFIMRYTRELPQQHSPDGHHVAITTYTVNTGTGVDLAEIVIRHSWSPLSHRVYAGPAQYQPNATTPDPNVQWLDNTHLRIRFNTYASTTQSADLTPQGCASQADGVTILCEQTLIHATH